MISLNRKKAGRALVAAIVALTGALSLVQSHSAYALPILAENGVNQFTFNMVQNLHDTDGNGVANAGDLIYGIFNVTKVSSGGSALWDANNVPGPGVDSFSGYYLAAITSTTPLPAPWAASVTLGAASFDPNGVFSASELASHAAVKLFTDNLTPFETNGSVADDIAKATDGTMWASWGFDGGGYWNALLMQNGLIFAGGGLNLLANMTGQGFSPLNDPSCTTCAAVDMFFNTVATDNGPNTIWRFTGGNTVVLRTVPEPSAIWLAALGMFLLAMQRSMRRKGRSQLF
jgi:hypothetical protein